MACRLVLIKLVLQAIPLLHPCSTQMGSQRNKASSKIFSLGRNDHKRKWALVKWDTSCLPKKGAIMGLRNPSHSNEVMGARIWWKWLTAPLTPWASLWTAKYARNCPTDEKIRISEVSKGSLIWNSAKQHRNLIQDHNFWEVKNGHYKILGRFMAADSQTKGTNPSYSTPGAGYVIS